MWVKIFSIVALLLFVSYEGFAKTERPEYIMVIHGGAGNITPERLTKEREAKIHAKLNEALLAGETILKNGGSSMDAITATIKILENSPLFNAGRGAVFAANGKNELDSSIMDGKTLNTGAVSGVRNIKNPITLARAVMEKSVHVMMQGKGAEKFAKKHDIERAPDSYFRTDVLWQQLLRAKANEKAQLDNPVDYKFGTVGAVALDKHGNIAAGTSTGGMTNKSHGRVGDSPIIGAGTYANNESCGVSGTGHGEYFIRATVARNICAMMEYGGKSLKEAADAVVMKQLVEMGGSGGIIAVDKDGNYALTFNSAGMYRGVVASNKPATTALYGSK